MPHPPIVIGYSTEGRVIEVWPNGPDGHGGTLIIGGFHGDEPATIELVRDFVPPPGARVALLPLLNPDGALRYTRYNARGVDLNRNFSTNWRKESVEPPGDGPWSEVESRALRDFIRSWRPAKIVSTHWALGEIDADGEQSTPLAEAIWAALDEPERIAYRLRVTELGRGLRRLEQTYVECPGSLGQWAGYGLDYHDGSRPAIITLELPHDPKAPRTEPLPADHWATVQKRWREDATGYLLETRGTVEKMFLAAATFNG